MTPAEAKEYRAKRAAFRAAMEARGLRHWSGKVWITIEEFERRYAAALESGRKIDEQYRNRLIGMYGKVPEWAPERIRRA